MRSSVRQAGFVAMAAVVLSAGQPAALKDPVGVYAVIDRVVFEPSEANAERIQLWGVFTVSKTFEVTNGELTSISFGTFDPDRNGYMYFTLRRGHEETMRAEWRELSRSAGTGRRVGFGSRIPPAEPKSGPVAAAESNVGAAGTISSPKSNKIDMAQVEWLMRYNGRVRDASESPARPDTFPRRWAPTVSGRFLETYATDPDPERVPEPLSPAGGAVVPAGTVRLVTRNLARGYDYVFEIEDPRGSTETSPPIRSKVESTTFTPSMMLQAGKVYTWRVRVLRANGESVPAAEVTFRVEG